MKKLISLVVAIVLMLSFTVSAFAATIDDFVEKAAGEVGTSYEMDPNKDYYIREEPKYNQWYVGLDWFRYIFQKESFLHRGQWCVMFVSWCSDQVGLGIPAYATVTDMKNWYISEGRYHYKEFYTPKKGDIVFFVDENHEDSHVGIIESVEISADVPTKDGKWIKMTTIEGDCIKWEGGQKSCTVDRGSYELRTSRPWENTSIVGFGEN